MEHSDCVVLWGTNAVVTQVNVMTHAIRARKARGAPIVAVDIYDNPTMRQADVRLMVRPGTDGALACGVMHALFRDGFADLAYLARYADDPAGLEAHLASRTPGWASAICGVPADDIVAFAHLLGPAAAHLLPHRLWLCAFAQRRRRHACRVVDSRRDGRLAT